MWVSFMYAWVRRAWHFHINANVWLNVKNFHFFGGTHFRTWNDPSNQESDFFTGRFFKLSGRKRSCLQTLPNHQGFKLTCNRTQLTERVLCFVQHQRSVDLLEHFACGFPAAGTSQTVETLPSNVTFSRNRSPAIGVQQEDLCVPQSETNLLVPRLSEQARPKGDPQDLLDVLRDERSSVQVSLAAPMISTSANVRLLSKFLPFRS